MSAADVEKLSERHILNRNKNTIIGPYLNIIYKMLRDGFKGDFIYSYILHMGYKGKPSTMIDIIKCIALNNFGIHLQRDFPFYEDMPASVSAITRSNVLKYITVKDNTSMKDSDTAKYIAVIKEAYPIVFQMEERQVVSVVMTSIPIRKSAESDATPGPTNSITLFFT